MGTTNDYRPTTTDSLAAKFFYDLDRSVLRPAVDDNVLDIHAALLERFPALPQRSPARNALELRVHYDRISTDPSSIIIRSAVAFYKEAAKLAPCAIVSGSPHDDVAAAAKLCGIADVTSFELGAEDYACGKPAPDGYRMAAKRLDVAPANCLVIEDSTAGVQAGLAAGMNLL